MMLAWRISVAAYVFMHVSYFLDNARIVSRSIDVKPVETIILCRFEVYLKKTLEMAAVVEVGASSRPWGLHASLERACPCLGSRDSLKSYLPSTPPPQNFP
jgi:hypothetical protein